MRIDVTSDDTLEVSKSIQKLFVAHGKLELFTDGPNQYNTALKAVAVARQKLAALGVDLAAETCLISLDTTFSKQEKLKIILSNKA